MKRLYAALLLTLAVNALTAQDSFYDDYNDFLKNAREEYNNFREQANREYAEFLSAPWTPVEPLLIQKPVDRTRPPRPIEEYEHDGRDHSIKYDNVVRPAPPVPQPQPVEPVVVKPDPSDKWLEFSYLGNSSRVRIPDAAPFRLSDVSESATALCWTSISDGSFDATLADCLELRRKYNLPDWAYLKMLDTAARAYFGSKCNESTLLTAWLYSQSGYTMRLARENDTRLVMMFASDHVIYGSYYTLGGEKYFPFDCKPSSLRISQASFPREKSMSLVLTSLPLTAPRMSEPRSRKSRKYPDMAYDISVDENLIDFFNTYPNSQLGNEMMTRWAIYANTPMSRQVTDQLYPALRANIRGLGQREQVQRILNWVQTGFVYEYDDKVWGGDRAFFPDETIYYPYADCEDRAILFSRLVRDLVGLDAILVYYPGHLASGVAFGTQEEGDYIMLNGRRFTVCDPTFTSGAPVGRTATGMDNSTATVILLSR
ncbi:MAG: hypothetical protein NC328_04610 [Muribaculum sp.]|nr:hypothetical protein [Muribaculum sp.]